MSKVFFKFSLPVAYYEGEVWNWYHRDAKRIMRKQAWNSRNGNYLPAVSRIIEINTRLRKTIAYWVVDCIEDSQAGHVRVIPLGQLKSYRDDKGNDIDVDDAIILPFGAIYYKLK